MMQDRTWPSSSSTSNTLFVPPSTVASVTELLPSKYQNMLHICGSALQHRRTNLRLYGTRTRFSGCCREEQGVRPAGQHRFSSLLRLYRVRLIPEFLQSH